MLAAIAFASRCEKKICSSKLSHQCYSKFHNSNENGFTYQLFVKGIRGFSTLRRTRNYHYIGCIKNIPISWPFGILRNSVDNRQSLATKVSPPEVTTDEILNQILSATEDPCVSKEEICISYIKTLCIAGNLLAAARLMQSLHGKNIYLGPCAYNYLMQAAGQVNDIVLLSEIFKDLLVSCDNIRLASYLILAGAFAKHNDSAMLLKFIEEVSEMALPRKDIVLNKVIFAFAKCGHIDKALLIFNHLKSLTCKPDLVSYNTILAFLGRLGRVDEMLQEFTFMKTVDLIPDVVTYNTVLNSLRKMGRLDLCLAYYKEMSEKGLQPDVFTFKALIESLGRSGNIEEALKFFDVMKCKRICPSIHIYRALIFSLKRMGKMELALKFEKEMNELLPEFVCPRNFQYRNR